MTITIGSTITNNKIISKETETDKLVMGPREVTSIASDINDTSHKSLVTANLLNEGMIKLETKVNNIDPNNIIYKDTSVVSQSLIIDSFTDDSNHWKQNNYLFINGQAVLSNLENNYLKISSNFFTYKGTYFLIIDVDRLDSGYIVIENHYRDQLDIVNINGKHFLEIQVENPDIQELYFICRNVYPGDSVIFNSISLHHSTDRIQDYLLFKIAEVSSGGMGGFVTTTELNARMLAINNTINQLADELSKLDLSTLILHIENTTDNVHGVTPIQIGAANKIHTHERTDITNFTHNHSASECNASELNHRHSLLEVGVAGVGAAAENHTHNEIDILNQRVDAITEDNSNSLISEIYDFTYNCMTQEEQDNDESLNFSEAIDRTINNKLSNTLNSFYYSPIGLDIIEKNDVIDVHNLDINTLKANVVVCLECISDELGYTVGSLIENITLKSDGASLSPSVELTKNEIILPIGYSTPSTLFNSICLIDKSSPGNYKLTAIDYNKWKIRFKMFYHK